MWTRVAGDGCRSTTSSMSATRGLVSARWRSRTRTLATAPARSCRTRAANGWLSCRRGVQPRHG